MGQLAERWTRLCAQAGASGAVRMAFMAVAARYAEPPRAYHTLAHVAQCMAAFDQLADLAVQPIAVEFALWLHDAVYDTHRTDNEAKSAEFAQETLAALGAPRQYTDPVPGLILLTRHDAVPASIDGRIIVDADLAILGAPPEAFDAYDIQIREEYAWVNDAQFWPARAHVLRAFLQRPVIYHTSRFHARYEATARQNLQRAIARAEAHLSLG